MKSINNYIIEKFKINKDTEKSTNQNKLLDIIKSNKYNRDDESRKRFMFTYLGESGDNNKIFDYYFDDIDTLKGKKYKNHPIIFYVVEEMQRKIKCKLVKPIYIDENGVLYESIPEDKKPKDFIIAPGEILDKDATMTSYTQRGYRSSQYWLDSYYRLICDYSTSTRNPYSLIAYFKPEWNDKCWWEIDRSKDKDKIYNLLGL